MDFLHVNLSSRTRSSSNASDSGRKNKYQRPVLAFTDHVEELKQKYIGRDGTGATQFYVPEHELKQYWTKVRVNEICKSYSPHLTIKHEAVNKQCLRMFSILVYIGRTDYFDPFLERGITDAKLPLADGDIPYDSALRAPVYKDVLENLLLNQWIFCPLVLEYAALSNRPLHPNQILPFRSQIKIADGDAADVYKVVINGDCNKLEEAEDFDPEEAEAQTYILKTYTDSCYRPLYQNEERALTTLRQPKSEHIVGYYGSFVQNNTYNLILQFADGGNLLDYYKNTPPPEEPSDIQRFWTSLFSLFKGLHAVHRISASTSEDGEYRGIHQDIKPDNILLMKGPSESPYDFRPILADFGHSHVRVTTSEQGGDEAEMGVDRQGNQTYGAPECSRHAKYLLNLPGRVPTAADIFSTGCIISDAASWVFLGTKGREMYRALRVEAGKTVPTFEDEGHYDCFHNAVDRSEAVGEMHNRIRNECHEKKDSITPDILALVETYMLLWDWRRRLEASQLWERFKKMSNLPLTPEPEMKEQAGPVPPSKRDRLKAEILRLKDMASTMPSLPQNLPSPPFSDPSGSVTSPGYDAATSSSNCQDPQLLSPPSPDAYPPTSPKLSSRPGLEAWENTKRFSRSLNAFTIQGIRSRSTSRQRPDSIQENDSNREPGLEDPNASLLSLDDNAELLRPHTPLVGLAGIRSRSDACLSVKTHLSLQEALEWRTAWKAYNQAPLTDVDATPKASISNLSASLISALPSRLAPSLTTLVDGLAVNPDTASLIRSLYRTLWGRDHIFVIDTSRSMCKHKPGVEDAFKALSYLVKRRDENRGAGDVWLVLGPQEDSNTPTVRRDTKTSKLLMELEKCRYDRMQGLLEDEFSDVVEQEIIPRLPFRPASQQQEGVDAKGSRNGKAKDKSPNPLSIIVLTDGNWGGGPDGAGMQNPILRLIETVKERKLKRTQVMVQFVRFGDSTDGVRHLRFLVEFGKKNECDIIDTQPVSGNVCEMLIGSLNDGREINDS